jgi:hypothetical protein
MADEDGVHAENIGFATKRLKHRYRTHIGAGFYRNRDPALEDYQEKARVDWDHPCALPLPMRDGKGAMTGARRFSPPPIFRPYTSNTRKFLIGHRKYTGMNHYGYAADIVESKKVPPFIPETARLAQEGCPEILRHVPALRPGPHHFLFETSSG